jgi:hypothetical protein
MIVMSYQSSISLALLARCAHPKIEQHERGFSRLRGRRLAFENCELAHRIDAAAADAA